jgi:hypothetical protein
MQMRRIGKCEEKREERPAWLVCGVETAGATALVPRYPGGIIPMFLQQGALQRRAPGGTQPSPKSRGDTGLTIGTATVRAEERFRALFDTNRK